LGTISEGAPPFSLTDCAQFPRLSHQKLCRFSIDTSERVEEWLRVASSLWGPEVKEGVEQYIESGTPQQPYGLTQLLLEIPRRDAREILEEYWEQVSSTAHLLGIALYVGGEQLLEDADEMISEAEDTSDYLSVYGTQNKLDALGSEGLRRVVENGEPYFDNSGQRELQMLWRACNSQELFELREQVLDPLIEPEYSPVLSQSTLRSRFEKIADSEHPQPEIRLLGEEVVDAGKTKRWFLNELFVWLESNLNRESFEVVRFGVLEFGERSDVEALGQFESQLEGSAAKRVREIEYLVSRRTLE